MKKIINWFLSGTYLWHTLLAFGTFGWGLMYENLAFMKAVGAFFAAFAVISAAYSFINSKKK